MYYAQDLIINFFDLLLTKEYEKWVIGGISPEDYFELRINEIHHHCPCKSDSADAIVEHFTARGVRLSSFHKPKSTGVMILKTPSLPDTSII